MPIPAFERAREGLLVKLVCVMEVGTVVGETPSFERAREGLLVKLVCVGAFVEAAFGEDSGVGLSKFFLLNKGRGAKEPGTIAFA